MIYAIGNSHAHFLSNSHPGTLGIGESRTQYCTSYSANFHNPQYRHVLAHKFVERYFPYLINAINAFNVTNNDYIMFIVGEIDCRWHFPKKVFTKNKTATEVVQECVDQFFPSFLYLKEHGYNVIGWGGHPSTTRGHSDDPDNPIYGDCLNRNKISLLWNDMLKEKCDKNNMKFVSIIRDLINPDGLTKMEYFMDDYHLTERAMPFVIDKFKEQGIIPC
jgi:hypothetical protein